jgi:D-glycero-alpha-D-manno-heptose-7-phosphate kinase
MKESIRARAPLRLGLAGGGTDVNPFRERHGGFVLNATIDLFAHVNLEPRDNGRIVFAAADRDELVEFDAQPELPDVEPLRLHRGIYNHIVRRHNGGRPLSFKLTTFADAPAGSGLGTSSTMVVSILQAFSEWLGLGLGEHEIANLAYQIEREELGLSGGKQDQYAAAFGGFNFMEFGPGAERVLVNPLRIKDWVRNELELSTVLFYTGQSRESARIIEQQIAASNRPEPGSQAALWALKQDALQMKEAILCGDLSRCAAIFSHSWEAKKQLAGGVSNPQLDALYDDAINAGATAGKISGAGGGGFFMFFVPPARRMALIRRLRQHAGEVVNFHFTGLGAQSWSRIG